MDGLALMIGLFSINFAATRSFFFFAAAYVDEVAVVLEVTVAAETCVFGAFD